MNKAMENKATILVVDDVPANIDLLVGILGDDYRVQAAMNGEKALQILSAPPFPDLILLDIMMPVMDGYEVCERLKDREETREIPIIFVTALDDVADETKGLALGAVDYITKPISAPIVRARVRNHLLLKMQHDQLKESISLMEHEREILQQKAELGIQAGSLAHDISNILSALAVVEFIPPLLPDDLPDRDEIIGCIEQVVASIRLGREICQGSTCYLRDIGAAAKLQPLAPLLQSIDIYARRYKGRLERDMAEDVPPIRCKGYQLKRVFVNLFANACQALEKVKEPQITLRLWSEGGQVLFSIADNGAGISAEALPHIFEERFTTKPEGTGLGLFLVKEIVDNHGGSIEVDSREGAGTTFTLAFPVG